MPGVCILVCVKVYMCACMCEVLNAQVKWRQRSEDEGVTSSAYQTTPPSGRVKQSMVPIT